jgi:predicted metal-dependent peptidase
MARKKKDIAKCLPYDKARDEKARDILIQARVKMLMVHDFWGKIATRMKLINADEWCATLATDGRNFYYNSQFVLNLKGVDKVVFGFAHEVLHCLYDHIARTGSRDKRMSNIAQDYVINADLVKHKVGTKIDEIDIIYDEKYYGWAWEAVYDDLMKNVQIINIEDLMDMLLDDHLEEGDDDENGDGKDGDNKDGVSKKRPKISAEEREKLKDEFREAVLQAAQGAKPGSLPMGIERMVNQLTDPKLDWRSLITMKIPSLAKNDYSYQRPNKKYQYSGIVMPGLQREESIDVCIAIDTSGSISQKQLEEVLSEIVGLMDMYAEFTLRIWQFDTAVYGYEQFTKDTSGDLLHYRIKGGGGTSFQANWDFMKEEGIEPKLFIMFTDGETGDGWGDPDYQEDMLWIINNPWNRNIDPPYGSWANYQD